MPVLIGTSGWQYRDWRGALYPPGLAERNWLEYYAGRYGTVENNGTFYRLPTKDTFAAWQAKVPGSFVMTVKASRYLTHVRRLRDPAEPVARLMRAAAGLGDRRVHRRGDDVRLRTRLNGEGDLLPGVRYRPYTARRPGTPSGRMRPGRP
jgi:hypothetical protein